MGYKNLLMKPSIILGLGLATLLLSSCSKESFAPKKNQDSFSASSVQSSSASQCAGFTLVKPPVDFLFLWDNTSSQYFVNDQTKQALNNTIALVSNRFDYHIMMAPLVGSGNSSAFLVAENPNGLTSSALNMLVPQSDAASRLGSFPTSTQSNEKGLERVNQLISNNRSNHIFRQNSYVIIVLMSNGDDLVYTNNGLVNGPATNNYIEQQKNTLFSLKNAMSSEQMRFISLVAFNACQSGFKANYSYKKMSDLVYIDSGAYDQAGRPFPDSYDICSTGFIHLFDGINNAIQDVLINHVYDAWPISSNAQLTFNPDTIKVKKSNGQEFFPVSGPGNGSGFRYIGYTSRNTRLLPTPGEPFTGHMIELYDSARVTYPECLIVETETPIEYYGYVHLQAKPVVNTIKLVINGTTISQSTTNGWEYIGYKSSQNLKIVGPTNDSPASPALNKTGYFLKLRGSAIYSNGASVNVTYDPAGN